MPNNILRKRKRHEFQKIENNKISDKDFLTLIKEILSKLIIAVPNQYLELERLILKLKKLILKLYDILLLPYVFNQVISLKIIPTCYFNLIGFDEINFHLNLEA